MEAVGRLASKAIDRALLTNERVTSAAEGKRLLAGQADTEALAEDIQRVVILAVPVVRTVARGARFTRVPWVMIVSGAISIGVAVRAGVRELQVLASLISYRLEQATGTPSDPVLVEKLAIDVYLSPKRTPQLADDKLRLVRLTRKWVLSGAFGRKTSKRATKALDAAERLDAAALSARWAAMRRSGEESPAAPYEPPPTEFVKRRPGGVGTRQCCVMLARSASGLPELTGQLSNLSRDLKELLALERPRWGTHVITAHT